MSEQSDGAEAPEGDAKEIFVRRWENPEAEWIALLVHGYGEHVGRYEHVAAALVGAGAVVFGADHVGHGQSGGERVLFEDADALAGDVQVIAGLAREQYPGLPLVVIGHSMGGLIATRWAQLHPGQAAALVLSAPAIGANPDFEALAAMDPLPDVPIDPAALSRDPSVGEGYAADPLVWHGPFKRQTLAALLAAGHAAAEGPRLEGPVLWMHGSEDSIVPLAGVRETIAAIAPDAETRVWEGARHEIFNETNADEVLAHTTDFVGRALAG